MCQANTQEKLVSEEWLPYWCKAIYSSTLSIVSAAPDLVLLTYLHNTCAHEKQRLPKAQSTLFYF
jgi:hypothetical protein